MRLKPVLIALTALVALGLVIRRVDQATHRTFGGRPGVAQLARATPAYQNGLTLLAIDNVSPDHTYDFSDGRQNDTGGSMTSVPAADTALWIELPPNVPLPANCYDSLHVPCRDLFTLTARTSDGQELPLRWRPNVSQGGNGPAYILASIPAGYPDTVRWADVTMEDHHGDTAKWRILHLPPMQHVLAPPVTPQTTFHQGNITMTARAYHGTDPNGNGYGPMMLCDISGTITNAPNSWELGPMRLTREWEAPGYVAPGGGSTFGTNKDARNKVTIEAKRQAVYYNQTEMYPGAIHWVLLDAPLQEYGTYNETVTFHDLSVVKYRGTGGQYLSGAQPQTATTPSGVTITLVDIQHQKLLKNSWGGDGTGLLIRYPQGDKYASLPRSPLWRRHKGVISVSVEVPKPYEAFGSSGSGAEATYAFRSDKPLPKLFPTFPVIVRQRVDLRRVPVTFTLPVLGRRRPNPATSRAPSLLGKGGHKAQ